MIKFADLRIKDPAALDSVFNVMRSGNFINGPYNDMFAKQWANECQAETCVLTSSGTAALQAVLHCLALTGQDNIVIMPALSFAATAFAAIEAGCKIAYVDVNERGLIRWDQAEDLLNQYKHLVTTITPVWLYGQSCYAPKEIADRLVVVDDACQAHGAYKIAADDPAIGCFSFYPSKNLGAMGDAGAVVFNNMHQLAKRVTAYCNYGDPPGMKYVHDFQGNNLRCDHIQAAYLSATYNNLAYNNAKRAEQAAAYMSAGIPTFASELSSWHLYPILVEDPEKFKRMMADYNVEVGNHYPYILPKVAPGITQFGFSQAQYISQHVITLPIGPHLSLDDISIVAATIHKTCKLENNLWHIKL